MRPKKAKNIISPPPKKILIGKIGEFECANGDGESPANKSNELIFECKRFHVREELDAIQLENDVDSLEAFEFAIVTEDARDILYLTFLPDFNFSCRNLRSYERLVKIFFASSKQSLLDFAHNDVLDHFDTGLSGEIDSPQNEHANDDTNRDMVSELYQRLRQMHFEHDKLVTTDAPVQHKTMNATLKSYQAAAVRWMLHRELCQRESSMFEPVFRRWPPSGGDDGEKFYYNPYKIDLSIDEMPAVELPSGGILADEMGLGKTVEALALILLNQRPTDDLASAKRNVEIIECIDIVDSDDDVINEPSPPKKRKLCPIPCRCICQSSQSALSSALIKCSKCFLRQHRECVLKNIVVDVAEHNYICPQCWNSEELIKTSATIIVSPRSIKLQWFHEVQKHINADNFKVLIYDGIRNANWISPIDLASYDLVLIDYETMHSEIKFVNASKVQRVARAAPRFIKPISPLLKLDWWRVCLDEAQMVHSGITSAAQLVAQLPAKHRWAITGTPIDKSIKDLYGLFCFLKFEPYKYSSTFFMLHKRFTSGENDELIELLWHVMWRTCKSADILNEIAIPNQTEVVHFITPSDSELCFYNEQFVSCYQAFQVKANRLAEQQDRKLLSNLSPHMLKLLMEPLRKLRQDCSMPSVLQKTDQRMNKNLLKPDDLLQHLISNTEIKTKSELRTIASSLNGLAALHIIQNKCAAAITMYKNVLKWATDYTTNISVDSLLQVHALHNLLVIESNLPPNERERYADQLRQMEQKYIETSSQLVAKVQIEQKKYLDRAHECRRNFVEDEFTWWAEMLADRDADRTVQLMRKIFAELMEKDCFSSSDGLSIALTNWLDKLNAERDGVYAAFKKLSYLTDNLKALPMLEENLREKIRKLIDHALDCHLDPRGARRVRKQGKRPVLCALCLVKEQLEKYEKCIQPEKKNDDKVKGTWKVSKMEMILRIMLSHAKQFDLSEDMHNDAKNHLKLMEALHSEFTALSQLWVEVNHTVSLYDEIEMCKSRLMAYDPLEMDKFPAHIANLYVSKYEIDDTMLEMHDQMKEAELEFVRKMGRLKYLNHLKKTNELENCPICCQKPEEKYVVLECGHHMCMVCGLQWIERTGAGVLTCSICRHTQRKKNLYYVTLRSKENLTDSSSKIEEIVRTIIKLKQDDAHVKIVIFSHWPDILSILENALYENKIDYRSKLNPFGMTLSQFKDPKLNVTCLLLPLKYGGKGLNLTEATHVFLVEPILNPGEQLQAIGRIHRMGQTRPTFVHRFIMKNMIEETIYEQSKCDIWAFKSWTIENLHKLFLGKDHETDNTDNN